MTAKVIILESKCHSLRYADNCFPVADGYFLPVVEFLIEKYCLWYADNRLTVVVSYFLSAVEFSFINKVS